MQYKKLKCMLKQLFCIMAGHLKDGHNMLQVGKRPGSLTTMLKNHHEAYTYRICIKI